MTRRRHFKDLVRARMARTGESYSAARAQLARRARADVVGGPIVIVPVSDMDRATGFYSNGLGLSLRATSPTWTIVGDDGETIALEPAGGTGIDLGLGLQVADLPATLRAVVASGGRVEQQQDAWARVADPDGNLLRVMTVHRAPAAAR